MKNVPIGRWQIESVLINSATVMNFEGFEYLENGEQEISILPIGIKFNIEESSEDRALLKSRDATYFVASEMRGDELWIEMKRPNCSEVFEITATLAAPAEPIQVPGEHNQPTAVSA